MSEQDNGEDPSPSPRVGKLRNARDVAKELGRLYRAARRGDLDHNKAGKLAFILNSLRAALETGDLEARVEELERRETRR